MKFSGVNSGINTYGDAPCTVSYVACFLRLKATDIMFIWTVWISEFFRYLNESETKVKFRIAANTILAPTVRGYFQTTIAEAQQEGVGSSSTSSRLETVPDEN